MSIFISQICFTKTFFFMFLFKKKGPPYSTLCPKHKIGLWNIMFALLSKACYVMEVLSFKVSFTPTLLNVTHIEIHSILTLFILNVMK